jgi:hypothetical protein
MKITNWKDCIRNRTKWKKLVQKAKNFSEVVAPQEEEEESSQCLILLLEDLVYIRLKHVPKYAVFLWQ